MTGERFDNLELPGGPAMAQEYDHAAFLELQNDHRRVSEAVEEMKGSIQPEMSMRLSVEGGGVRAGLSQEGEERVNRALEETQSKLEEERENVVVMTQRMFEEEREYVTATVVDRFMDAFSTRLKEDREKTMTEVQDMVNNMKVETQADAISREIQNKTDIQRMDEVLTDRLMSSEQRMTTRMTRDATRVEGLNMEFKNNVETEMQDMAAKGVELEDRVENEVQKMTTMVGEKGTDRAERNSDKKGRIIDRKTFHQSLSKISGAGGEPEVRGFTFELRQFLTSDPDYLNMMKWIEKVDGDLTKEVIEQKKLENPDWSWEDMDNQLFSILVAVSIPKSTMASKLMALEKRTDVPRGMTAYHDLTRELVGSTQSPKAFIANRVRNPNPIAAVEDIDVRMQEWEADVASLEIYESPLSDTMKMSILRDMIPESVRQVVRMLKPDTMQQLKKVLKDEAKEYREQNGARKLKAKGLHAAEADAAEKPEGEEPGYVWD